MPNKLTATLQKESLRRLDAGVIRQQVAYIIKRMLDAGRGDVWDCKPHISQPKQSGDHWLYSCTLSFTRIGRKVNDNVQQSQYENMLRLGQAAGNSSSWSILELESTEKTVSTSAGETIVSETPSAPKTYTDKLNLNLADHFANIYDREAQIETVHSALRAFNESDYNNRFHCVLWGEPACGKTAIAKAFSKMLGNDAVLELDATSTTKAGAERILLESESLPPVLICEEIEKTDEASLRWLLSALDQRAEVRKVTHNKGLRQRDVKMFCIATVNDIGLFRKVMAGALSSRFTWQLECPRPSKDVLRKILEREVALVSGDRAWIEPALTWCVDEACTNDPRQCVAVCLCGREKLLTGEYQRTLSKIISKK